MAMTPAEKMKKYRQRLKEGGGKAIQITLSPQLTEVIDRYRAITGETTAEVLENILTTWACDTTEALPKLEEWAAQRNNHINNLKGG